MWQLFKENLIDWLLTRFFTITHTTISFVGLVGTSWHLVTSFTRGNTTSVQASELVGWTWTYTIQRTLHIHLMDEHEPIPSKEHYTYFNWMHVRTRLSIDNSETIEISLHVNISLNKHEIKLIEDLNFYDFVSCPKLSY